MRTALLPLLLLAFAGPAAAQHAGHHPQAAPPAAAPAPAKRFATDERLREDMAAIRTAVEGLDHFRMGHVDADEARRLAAEVQARVNDIIAHCKLPPEADAALHTVIVPLMQSAAALQKDLARTDALAPMQDALARYARQFDDPDFAADR